LYLKAEALKSVFQVIRSSKYTQEFRWLLIRFHKNLNNPFIVQGVLLVRLLRYSIYKVQRASLKRKPAHSSTSSLCCQELFSSFFNLIFGVIELSRSFPQGARVY